MNGVGFLNLMNASVRIPCQKSGSDRIIKFRAPSAVKIFIRFAAGYKRVE